MADHMYSHEVSITRGASELTTLARMIEVAIVMMTSEKMPARASFLLHFIWTPHNILIGIIMTAKVLANSQDGSETLLKKSVSTSQAQFNWIVSLEANVFRGFRQLATMYSNDRTRQAYSVMPMQTKYVAMVKTNTVHHIFFWCMTFVPRRLKKRRNAILMDQRLE